MRRLPSISGAVLFLGLVFLYAPIVALVVYSFNASRLVGVWAGFSTRWYASLLGNEQVLEATWLSIEIAALNATVAVALLAGVAEVNLSPLHRGVIVQSPDQLHRVEKPWGEEVWINGRHPGFAFKRIVLRE